MSTAGAAPAASSDPFALLASLVVDDRGTLWGEQAVDRQWADARAILTPHDPSTPRLHFLTRPRGGSKTTDTAAVALVALLTQAPSMSESLAYARDKDQAAILLDFLRALVIRTGLSALVDVQAFAVVVRASGARLTVESADAGSAHGHLPWLVVVDEIAQWPSTRAARALWAGIVSGLPKRSDSRLVVLTTAGDPAHWSRPLLEAAKRSVSWRVSEMPGPLPWLSEADLEEQARLLTPSEHAQLHLNIWTAAEDRLADPADIAACVVLPGTQPAESGRAYVIGADLGLTRDRTALAVCHAEKSEAGPAITLDRLDVLTPTPGAPVRVSDVERHIRSLASEYRGARVRMDPWEARGLIERLRHEGVRAELYRYSAQSVVPLASALMLAIRERRMALPDDIELIDELSTVRLRPVGGPGGGLRMDHDSGRHDDRAQALALAVLALTEKPEAGRGSVSVPRGRIPKRDLGLVARRRDPLTPGLLGSVRTAQTMTRDVSLLRGLPGSRSPAQGAPPRVQP